MNTYIRKVRGPIAAQVLWSLLGSVCLACAPLLQEWVFDHGRESRWEQIAAAVGIYFGLLVLYSVSEYACMIYAFRGAVRFEKALKRDFFHTIFHMDSTAFRKRSIGEYISIQGNDITALDQDYLCPLVDVIRSVNLMIVYGVVLFVGVDWRIALVIILTSAAAILIPKLLGRMLTQSRNVWQGQMARYVETIQDLLEGFYVIGSATREPITRRHETVLAETADRRYAYGKSKSMVLGVSELLTKLVRAVTFAVVAYLFYRGEVTVGVGVATLSYVTAFIEPIDSLLYDITTMQSMKEIKGKIMSIVNSGNVVPLTQKNAWSEISSLKTCRLREAVLS